MKTVLITGATRGIGWALAKKVVAQKNLLYLHGRDEVKVQNRLTELKDKYPQAQVIPLVFDVTDRQAIKSAKQKITKLDILINNAGVVADNWWKNLTDSQWDRVIATNLTGVYNVSHGLLDKLQDGSKIVLMSSNSGLLGNPGQANYSASKAGLVGLTYTLAQELARFNVEVFGVTPAAKTEMTLPVIEKLQAKYGKLPLMWQMGSPEDVADFVFEFLLSKAQSGRIYGVNGKNYGYWTLPEFIKID